MSPKITHLIAKAKQIMISSRDPIHDLDHVTRVAAYTEDFGKKMNLTTPQQEALVLAAWWHDSARTLTKRPSIFWMAVVDDMISALMLWRETLRYGLFGSVAGMASRIILCKSLGTGAFFTRIFMRKRNRILVDLLKDADTLDLLNQARMERMRTLADSSFIYRVGYKASVRWFLSNSQLAMKTHAAREYVVQMLRSFIAWVRQEAVFAWHRDQFGKKWIEDMLRRGEALLSRIVIMNNQHIMPS